ncbi:hypothetical membrane protein (plasmid) [Clavibacter michiganensis subsp. michiganensis NCPPB 382]|uniref:Hypothetical membrane protein n=1 Tax=Clavibacter michiganensis subsp. michiganensis (strain NCPPB 382) TaxID=443906 RepID=A5CLN7_CLAM3|nr:hypothetical membrane protein [Clavibacter michiganensis subsp. michiganensis NCPPB 382]
MISEVAYAAIVRAPHIAAAADGAGYVVAQAYCLPGAAQDGMDTGKLWLAIAAVFAAVCSLVMIGMGMWFQTQHHDGGAMFKTLSRWILGAVTVAGASGIATAFLGVISTACTPIPT